MPRGEQVSILSSVTTQAPRKPGRFVLYAFQKWGKTSWAAHAPKAIFLMTQGEDGLLTLKSRGLVPQTVYHLPEATNRWCDLCDAVEELIREKHDFKTLIIDTGNGAERMLAEDVCYRAFNEDWSAFAEYGKGERLCQPEWTRFLSMLDALRNKRGMSVILLHHAMMRTVANPTGKDWDQYQPEGMKSLVALTKKWADGVLYGGWKVNVGKVKGEKGGDDKALGEERYVQCGNSSAIDAGNRYGLPETIFPRQPGAAGMWAAFQAAMAASVPNAAPASPPPPANSPANNGQARHAAPASAPPPAATPQNQPTQAAAPAAHTPGPEGGIEDRDPNNPDNW